MLGLALTVLLHFADVAPDQASAVVLAQAAVAEGGWEDEREHAAVWHVLRRRAGRAGVTDHRMAELYCSVFKIDTRRSRWIRSLRSDGERPDHWPTGLKWENYRERWLEILARAQRFQVGGVENPCPGADHFGDRKGDKLRAERAGWRPVACDRANLFWRSH